MKKFAVIVAGGIGLRMGTALPKQFLLIHSKPLLWYTLQTFLRAYKDLQIILVLPQEYYETGRVICEEVVSEYPILTIVGGPTRFHSVRKGLELIHEESVIFIHDAVRCLLTPSLIHLCFDETVHFGSAIPCIDSKDSVRIKRNNNYESIQRADVKLVQTPQTFLSSILLPSYAIEYNEVFTDDASVVEACGHKIHFVAGEENNIKITNPLDLGIAEKMLGIPNVI